MKSLSFAIVFAGLWVVVLSCNPSNKSTQNQPVSQPVSVKDTQSTSHIEQPIDSMIPTADNSRISLDWAGTYRGIVPCVDCDGIKTEMVLDASGTYRLTTLYLGVKGAEPIVFEGKFEWDKSGNKIMLKEPKIGEAPKQYQVGEEKLFELDRQGKRITGKMADKYILHKYYPDTIITGKYWKLIEVNGKKIGKQLKQPHMVIIDNQVRGNGGCNTFSGRVQITPMHRIVFQNLVSTKMACMDDGRNSTESLFFNALNTADQYQLKQDTLSLSKGRMAPLARLVYDYFGE